MSIELELKRIADALETLVQEKTQTIDLPTPPVIEKAKKTGMKKARELAESQLPPVTKELLADALRELVLKKSPVIAKATLEKFGATRLSEIKEADYTGCYEALIAEAANA